MAGTETPGDAPARPGPAAHAAVTAAKPGAQALLQAALQQVQANADQPVMLRAHGPGDMGWVVHRQGQLYVQEYGWNLQIEATVAQIVADFLRQHDPAMERCWIAERGGHILGSVFLVRRDEHTAQLRLLYVEPAARGTGLGERLVRECVAHAQALGYRRMVLWTQGVLDAARAIYAKLGFVRVKTEPYAEFGPQLLSEEWLLEF